MNMVFDALFIWGNLHPAALFKIKLAVVKACKNDLTTTALLVFFFLCEGRVFLCLTKALFNNHGRNQSQTKEGKKFTGKHSNRPLANYTFNVKY